MAESVEKIFHLSEQVISSVLWCSRDIVKVRAFGGGVAYMFRSTWPSAESVAITLWIPLYLLKNDNLGPVWLLPFVRTSRLAWPVLIMDASVLPNRELTCDQADPVLKGLLVCLHAASLNSAELYELYL